MSILDQIPAELLKRIRENAEHDLKDLQAHIQLLVNEARGLSDDFDAHVSLMAALLIKFINDPVPLAMMFAESIFMLAEEKKES